MSNIIQNNFDISAYSFCTVGGWLANGCATYKLSILTWDRYLEQSYTWNLDYTVKIWRPRCVTCIYRRKPNDFLQVNKRFSLLAFLWKNRVFVAAFTRDLEIVASKIKGSICHSVEWQIELFISERLNLKCVFFLCSRLLSLHVKCKYVNVAKTPGNLMRTSFLTCQLKYHNTSSSAFNSYK